MAGKEEVSVTETWRKAQPGMTLLNLQPPIKHCLKAKILHNELMHALQFVAKLLSATN